MATQGSEFLIEAATYLGAAAIAVPIFHRLKLGSIIGYLAAGVAIGPAGLNLLRSEEGVFHVAELGVVLFLFVIGLELSVGRLWSMRKAIFGLGAAQMTVTGIVIAVTFVAAGVMPAPAAALAGLSLAFSSTALALQMLKDRGELNSEYGSQSFSILLFQDLAVIPLLAAVPLVAGASMGEDWGFLALKAGGVLVALVVIGVFVLDRVFRLVASSGSREAFAATALFVVALTSVAVSWAGLSMALGAFLAGALLADSAYRRQIETDIEPFRGLLLGLFFISIGMRLDMEVIAEYWWVIVGGAIGLLTVKSVLLFLLAKSFGSNTRDSAKTAAVLSQGGEFAFVVLSLGVGEAVFTNQQATLMSAIVTISMALTPLAMMLANRSFRDNEADSEEGLEGPGSGRDHVIIVGFGRMGQIISQVLQNSGVAVTAIDRNPPRIRNAERFGYKVFYGDGSRLDVLLTAGALEARAVVFCMDDRKATSSAVAALRERCPTVTIVSVAHDRVHEIELQALGPDVIVRQTLESSLVMARETLRHMGFDEAIIDDFVDQFRESDRERLLAQIDAGVDAATHLIHQPYSARGDSGRNR